METVCIYRLCANFEMICLKVAGNAVKRASDNLVKAAQKAAFDKSEDDSVVVKTKFVGGIAQVRQTPEKCLCETWSINHCYCVVCPFHCVFAPLADVLKCHSRSSEIVMSCCDKQPISLISKLFTRFTRQPQLQNITHILKT